MPPHPRPTAPGPPPAGFICYPESPQYSYQPDITLVDHLHFSDHPGMELVLHNGKNRFTPAPTDSTSLTATWRADSGDSHFSAASRSSYNPLSLPYPVRSHHGSEFLVYHICQQCAHPRSHKYHIAHPVPPGAPPPLPLSICHRCQNTIDNRITEVYEESEIVPKLPEETKGKASTASERGIKGTTKKSRKNSRQTQATGELSSSSTNSSSETDENDLDFGKQASKSVSPQVVTKVIYRHVKAPASRLEDVFTEVQPSTRTSELQSEGQRNSASTPYVRWPEDPSRAREIQDRSREIQARSIQIQRRPSVLASGSTREVSGEVDNTGPTLIRHDVRRIAREEVKSYRDAERLMGDHDRPYRHGKFVPCEEPAHVESSSSKTQLPTPNLAAQSSTSTPHPDQERKLQPSADVLPGHGSRTIVEVRTSRTPIPPAAELDRPPQGVADKTTPRSYVSASTKVGKSAISAEGHSRVPKFNERGELAVSSRAARSTTDQVESGTLTTKQTVKPRDEAHDPPYRSEVGRTTNRNIEERTDGRTEYRRRDSLETDATVQPHSSISQRPVPDEYYYKKYEHQPMSRDQHAESQRTNPSAPPQWRRSDLDEIYGESRYVPPSAEDSVPRRHQAAPPLSAPVPSASSAAPPPSQGVDTSILTTQPRTQDKQDLEYQERQSSRVRYGKNPPDRPPSPPMDLRTSERRKTYREPISPWRDREVRERVIRSRPSPQRDSQTSQYRYHSPDRSRQTRDDRGRAKTRERDEKSSKRPRSILRPASRSPWEQHRTGSHGRSVSFSKKVEVDVLSPPPTNSDVSRVTEDMSRLNASDTGHRRNLREEKYYYENTRRPEPRREASDSDIEREKEYRRRKLARALSESPSREKGLEMMRGEASRPSHREKARNSSDYPPSPGRDSTRGNPARQSDVRVKSSQTGDADARTRRQPATSTRGGAQDERRGLDMSGALTDPPDSPRSSRPRRDDRDRYARREHDNNRDNVRSRDDRLPPKFEQPGRISSAGANERNSPRTEDPRRATGSDAKSETKRQVVVEINGQRKLVNVVKEGRDEHGKWVEVEETVVAPDQESDRRRDDNNRTRDGKDDRRSRRTEYRY